MKNAAARSQDPAIYLVPGLDTKKEDDRIIQSALNILYRRIKKTGPKFGAPDDLRVYLRLKTGDLEHEVFSVLFLDVQNRLICMEEMFRGTLTQCSVYPREVVKQALKHEAAAVVLTHNHPSGGVQPSRADEALTQTLKIALGLIDVRVLDHIIVSAEDALSMAERGLM